MARVFGPSPKGSSVQAVQAAHSFRDQAGQRGRQLCAADFARGRGLEAKQVWPQANTSKCTAGDAVDGQLPHAARHETAARPGTRWEGFSGFLEPELF